MLPVFNKQVLDYAIALGLATHCKIAPVSIFDRKHYFYPDLPKGYQVTQQFRPICTDGHVTIKTEDGTPKKIRIMRIHIEEDAGKNIHASGSESFVDLNRAGSPLVEIVTHPDLSSPEEARSYLKTLHTLVRHLGIGTGNMEEGAFRADTNISVRERGAEKYGVRCELKNINSFKFITDAAEYEINRHIDALEAGEPISQQTLLWDTKAKRTKPMRSKEESADYRFFEDPDLPLIEVNDAWIERVKATLPELPHEKLERLCKEYNLSEYEADILVENGSIARYFETAYQSNNSKHLINLVLRDVMGYLKEEKIELHVFKVTPEKLAALVKLLDDERINNRGAQEIFKTVAKSGADPEQVMQDKGLEQMNSADQIEAIVDSIISENENQVTAYRGGNERLFGFFVGQAMKKTGGNANPKVVGELLKKKLG